MSSSRHHALPRKQIEEKKKAKDAQRMREQEAERRDEERISRQLAEMDQTPHTSPNHQRFSRPVKVSASKIKFAAKSPDSPKALALADSGSLTNLPELPMGSPLKLSLLSPKSKVLGS